jgi:hypothetical protein
MCRVGPNDGLVSVASAQWGSYLGTLDNVNHAELVGWVEPWKTLTTKHINKHVSSGAFSLSSFTHKELVARN